MRVDKRGFRSQQLYPVSQYLIQGNVDFVTSDVIGPYKQVRKPDIPFNHVGITIQPPLPVP